MGVVSRRPDGPAVHVALIPYGCCPRLRRPGQCRRGAFSAPRSPAPSPQADILIYAKFWFFFSSVCRALAKARSFHHLHNSFIRSVTAFCLRPLFAICKTLELREMLPNRVSSSSACNYFATAHLTIMASCAFPQNNTAAMKNSKRCGVCVWVGG